MSTAVAGTRSAAVRPTGSYTKPRDVTAEGKGVREIAREIGRSPSTISRELRRNASTRTYRLEYEASVAQWHAERRARRPKTARLVVNDKLRRHVQERLEGAVRRPGDGSALGPAGPAWQGSNKPHR